MVGFLVLLAVWFVIAIPFVKCHGCHDERSLFTKLLDRFR